ncbi:MAG: hypothetical protein KDB80_07580 [Planctomycetes bacterium]|nr:hypothetical protein [Planctomycetota bacterium]
MPDISFAGQSGAMLFLYGAVLLLLAAVWVFQFVELMSLGDEELGGVHARIGWVAAFVLLWVLAPFAFLVWRSRAADSSGRRRERSGT